MADVTHVIKMFKASVKAALNGHFSTADYLKKNRGHSDEEVATMVEQAKTEYETMKQENV